MKRASFLEVNLSHTASTMKKLAAIASALLLAKALVAVDSFVVQSAAPGAATHLAPRGQSRVRPRYAGTGGDGGSDSPLSLSESDQVVAGVGGTAAALLVLGSEAVLKTTGCGLPAGPAGLIGAAEGISYLSVVGFVGWSLWTKTTTGSGLPAGPIGLLGLAEGLSFLAAAVGLAVLGFQVADYGYIPNAVPMEGGMCS